MKCLSELNKRQKEAVQHPGGPLLILAGAGSGKTRTLASRIAYLITKAGVDPASIFAVTFTNKAAREMRQRVEGLVGEATRGMWVSTFHSACARILREDIGRLGYDRNFNIIDSSDSVGLIKACMRDLNISDRLFSPRAVAARISALKGGITTPEEFAASAQPFGLESKVAKIYPMYQERLKASCVLDFDDLLMMTVQLFEKDRKLLSRYQERFAHVLVDEYQDTNPAQYRIVKMLAGRHRNICVVGDDDQSIYGFRGADLRNILEFEKDFPDTTVVKLEQNYRSTQRILDGAWSVISNNAGRREKKLWTDSGAGEKLEHLRLADEESEAAYIAHEVARGAREGRPYSDFAVLYRTNTQSRTLEEALRRESIPYVVVGGTKFYDRKEVRDVITYLKVIYNPKDSVSLKRVVNVPPRGMGEAAMKKAAEAAAPGGLPLIDALRRLVADGSIAAGLKRRIGDLLSMLDRLIEAKRSLPPSRLLTMVLDEVKYPAYIRESMGAEAPGKLDNLKELVHSIEKFEADSEAPSLETYLAQVSLVTDWDGVKAGSPVVSLMTLHLSKGLEFPVVFIAGLEEGLIPHAQSNCDRAELEEERRLLYVGMTRARRRLYLLSATSRRLAGLTQSCMESRFIQEIPQGLIQSRKPAPVKAAGRRPESVGRKPVAVAAEPARVDISFLFKNGERVYHQIWGWGVVERSDGRGDEQKITVQFKSVGKKKLLARMANLTRV